jgi:proline iminopeptidase
MPPGSNAEGFVEVEGGRVWYEVVGGGGGTPLITVHGGPGAPHDYLRSLEALAADRPVVFYDQLGCGNSEQPDDTGLWRVDRFVDELEALRAHLGYEEVHVLGQSWGTIVAAEYALRRPPQLKSVVFANPALSIPRFLADARKLVRMLPPDTQEVIERHEAAGTTESEEYQEAAMAFYQRHLCRLDPWPDEIMRTFTRLSQAVYGYMWGPSEFSGGGTLSTYDCSARIGELSLPALFLCGRYDECSPEATTWASGLVPGSELVIFEQSSHMPHLEESERYMAVVGDFLRRADPA